MAHVDVASHLTGQPLREARERAHLSQADVAARLRIGLRTYRNWESEDPPVPHPRHRRALEEFLAEIKPSEVAA